MSHGPEFPNGELKCAMARADLTADFAEEFAEEHRGQFTSVVLCEVLSALCGLYKSEENGSGNERNQFDNLESSFITLRLK